MQDDLQAQATGAIQQYLSQEDFRSMRIPLPALDEQRRIADLLDSELDSLDGISAARRKQLELLDERWDVQARCLVGGVVDSSGDSPADSSLAWLGPVNKSWASVAIGRISTTYTGTTFPHEFQGEADGDYPFVKVADFSLADDSGTLGVAKNWVTKSVARRLRARIVPEGAILYARVGAAMLLNQRRLVLREIIVDDNVRGLLFREGISRYWLYVLSFLDMGQLANPGPVPSVSEAQVSAVRVPFPPMEEQLRIVRELDSLAACHRQASSVLTRQLKLLAERRKSLIAAVVTGQVDVTTARGAKT
jgi:type I restriction enzyme S subunit